MRQRQSRGRSEWRKWLRVESGRGWTAAVVEAEKRERLWKTRESERDILPLPLIPKELLNSKLFRGIPRVENIFRSPSFQPFCGSTVRIPPSRCRASVPLRVYDASDDVCHIVFISYARALANITVIFFIFSANFMVNIKILFFIRIV